MQVNIYSCEVDCRSCKLSLAMQVKIGLCTVHHLTCKSRLAVQGDDEAAAATAEQDAIDEAVAEAAGVPVSLREPAAASKSKRDRSALFQRCVYSRCAWVQSDVAMLE